jgi:hypothetical protein
MHACLKGARRSLAPLSMIGVLALAGCAQPGPTEPTVVAMPKPGESLALFEQHDTTCRQYAAAQTGGQTPGQTAARSGVTGAAVGTGVGAASGALLGAAAGNAGMGAAIGAGTGLLFGSLMGLSSGQNSAAAVQTRYNTAYEQCMVANGEEIEQPAPNVVYATPAPVYMARPVFVRPAPVVIVPAPYP